MQRPATGSSWFREETGISLRAGGGGAPGDGPERGACPGLAGDGGTSRKDTGAVYLKSDLGPLTFRREGLGKAVASKTTSISAALSRWGARRA